MGTNTHLHLWRSPLMVPPALSSLFKKCGLIASSQCKPLQTVTFYGSKGTLKSSSVLFAHINSSNLVHKIKFWKSISTILLGNLPKFAAHKCQTKSVHFDSCFDSSSCRKFYTSERVPSMSMLNAYTKKKQLFTKAYAY